MATTDHTSADKNYWQLLSKAFQSRLLISFCSHGLLRFVKDVFSATKTSKGNDNDATYSVRYPFVDKPIFVSACMDLINVSTSIMS